MSKPNLIIVAGCNGSGKSTFSQDFVKDITPFDYDKKFLENYVAMQDSELRDKIARNTTTNEFESSINGAFSNGYSFCYETNFDSNPLYWVNKAKKLGYHLELHFYCLESQELAKERVTRRVKNNGHFVRNDIIDYKWKEGYKNLNLYFSVFDKVLIVDNSSDAKPIKSLFLITKVNEDFEVKFFTKKIPHYAEHRFPKIYQLLKKAKSEQNIFQRLYCNFFNK